MARVGLTRGLFALIDDEDAIALIEFRWRIIGSENHQYAARLDEMRRPVMMHRQLMGALPGELVDHVNGNTLDNRKANLRRCTAVQNSGNTRVPGKYGLKGINPHFDGRWQAVFRGKRLGIFDTPELAAKAYDEAIVEAYGDFAATNEELGLKLVLPTPVQPDPPPAPLAPGSARKRLAALPKRLYSPILLKGVGSI